MRSVLMGMRVACFVLFVALLFLSAQADAQTQASGAVVTPVPATAETLVPGSVPVDYKIGPNDLLDIEVFGVSELKRQVRVNTTGHVSMPLIGLVPLAGLSPADAEAMLAVAYGS